MTDESDLKQESAALQKEARKRNKYQDRQDAVPCQITIQGLESITGTDDWKSAFSETVDVDPSAAKYFGCTTVNTLDYLRVNANLNQVSFEREAFSILMSLGYRLEELEVEFDDGERRSWGICSWYKDHPSYHDPKLLKDFPKGTPEGFSYLVSMFKTEHAGDQRFTLMSGQMVAEVWFKKNPQFLFHKTLLFRRVVFSVPPQQQEQAA